MLRASYLVEKLLVMVNISNTFALLDLTYCGFAGVGLQNACVAEGGSLVVELLCEDGWTVENRSTADCMPLRGDSIAHVVRWGRDARVSASPLQKLKLRIMAREAALYSFRFARLAAVATL